MDDIHPPRVESPNLFVPPRPGHPQRQPSSLVRRSCIPPAISYWPRSWSPFWTT